MITITTILNRLGIASTKGKKTMREKFAEIAHNQWSGWMKYLFSKGTFNEDGTWTMPVWAVDRWKRQMETPYSMLSEDEQQNDRDEADKFLIVIKEYESRHSVIHYPRYDYDNRPT